MKRNLKIFLLAILTSSGFSMGLVAQLIVPNVDPNYVLVSNKSDEFSGTSLNSTLWSKLPTTTTWGFFGGIGYGRADLGRYVSCSPSNVVVSGGYLRLKLTGTNPTYFYMGQMESRLPNYLYGYFEISAKVVNPGYYNSSGQPILSGIWPTFWLYNLLTDCKCFHDEIDVLDNLYGDNLPGITPSEDTKHANGGIFSKLPESNNPNDTICETVTGGGYDYINSTPFFEAEHILTTPLL